MELPDRQRLACSLQNDSSAIYGPIKSDWSNGQTEGQVNRLKRIHRQMFGRLNSTCFSSASSSPDPAAHNLRETRNVPDDFGAARRITPVPAQGGENGLHRVSERPLNP